MFIYLYHCVREKMVAKISWPHFDIPGVACSLSFRLWSKQKIKKIVLKLLLPGNKIVARGKTRDSEMRFCLFGKQRNI